MNRSQARWSWSLGRIAGIDLRVHATFLVLCAWIVLSHVWGGHGLKVALEGLAFVLMVFAVVILHELGHALVARRFGIRTRDITLLPIGGVARLERMPTDPWQELLVAVAGPAVNVVLAAAAFAALVLLGAPFSPHGLAVVGGPLLTKLLYVNVALAAFNLLPAFPMDGGRVLRAVLAMRMNRVRATDRAARVGQLMALLLGMVGLFGSPMLVFVALFVWIGAAEEASLVHVSAALEEVRVGDAMVTAFESLPAGASVGAGIRRVMRSVQTDFPVSDGARLVGLVSAIDLLDAASHGRAALPIGAIAHPIAAVAAPGEPVEEALRRLEQSAEHVLPVLDAERLVGLLVPRNVLELAGLRDATAT